MPKQAYRSQFESQFEIPKINGDKISMSLIDGYTNAADTFYVILMHNVDIFIFCTWSCCRICMLGNRTLVRDRFDVCAKTIIKGNITVPSQLWDKFCLPGNMSSAHCDEYFIQNNVTEIQGIPGLGSGIIRGKNWQGISIWYAAF